MSVVADVIARFRADFSDLVAGTSAATEAVTKISSGASTIGPAFRSAGQDASSFADHVYRGSSIMGGLGSSVENVKSTFRDLVVTATGVAGFGGLINMAKNYTEEMQTLGVQFNATFGSQGGGAALKQAVGFADQFGISIKSSADAYQIFALATRGHQENFIAQQKISNDAAAGLGISIDQASSAISNFYQQAQRSGTTGALRGISSLLNEHIIDVQTANQLKVEIAQGFDPQALLATINSNIEKTFPGAGAAYAKTLTGQFQIFRNLFTKGVGGALSPITGGISDLLGGLNKEIQTPGFEHLVSQITASLEPVKRLLDEAGQHITSFFQKLSTPTGLHDFESQFAWVGHVIHDIEQLGAAIGSIIVHLVELGAGAAHVLSPFLAISAGVIHVIADLASFAAHSQLVITALAAFAAALVAIKIAGFVQALGEMGANLLTGSTALNGWIGNLGRKDAAEATGIASTRGMTAAIEQQTFIMDLNMKTMMQMAIAREALNLAQAGGIAMGIGTAAGLASGATGLGPVPWGVAGMAAPTEASLAYRARTAVGTGIRSFSSFAGSPLGFGLGAYAAGSLAQWGGSALGGGPQSGLGQAGGVLGTSLKDIGIGTAAGSFVGMPEVGAVIGAVVGLTQSLHLLDTAASKAAAALDTSAHHAAQSEVFTQHPIGTTAASITSSYQAAHTELNNYLQGTLSNHFKSYADEQGLYIAAHLTEGARHNLDANLGTLQQQVPGLTRSQAISQEQGAGIDLSLNVSKNATAINSLVTQLNNLGGAAQVAAEALQNAFSSISAQIQGGQGSTVDLARAFNIKAQGLQGDLPGVTGQQLFEQLVKVASAPNASRGFTGIDPRTYGINPNNLAATFNMTGISPAEAQQRNENISVPQAATDAQHSLIQAEQGVTQASWGLVDAQHGLIQAGWAVQQAAWGQAQAEFSLTQAIFAQTRAAFALSVNQTTIADAQNAYSTTLRTHFIPDHYDAAAIVMQLTGADQALGAEFLSQVAILQNLQQLYNSLNVAYQAASSGLQVLNDQLKALQDITNAPLVGTKAQQAQEAGIQGQIAAAKVIKDQLTSALVPTGDPRQRAIDVQIAALNQTLQTLKDQAAAGPGSGSIPSPSDMAQMLLAGIHSSIGQAQAQSQVPVGPQGGLDYQKQQVALAAMSASLEKSYTDEMNAAKSAAQLSAVIGPLQLAVDQMKGPLDALQHNYDVQKTYVDNLNTGLSALAAAEQQNINETNGILTAANAVLTAGNAVITAGHQVDAAQWGFIDAGHGIITAQQQVTAASWQVTDAVNAVTQANNTLAALPKDQLAHYFDAINAAVSAGLIDVASAITNFIANLASNSRQILLDEKAIGIWQGPLAAWPDASQRIATLNSQIASMAAGGPTVYPNFALGGYTGNAVRMPGGYAGYVHPGEFVLSADMLARIPAWQSLVQDPNVLANMFQLAAEIQKGLMSSHTSTISPGVRSFAMGGPTGGSPGSVAGIVHGGEYVLSADMLTRIANGVPVIVQSPSGSGGPSFGTISMPITVNGTDLTAVELGNEIAIQVRDAFQSLYDSWHTAGRPTNG